ncbi:MAG: GNAT family N-acetyltransferase [Candidatus Tumulicola sp.]
MAEIAIGPASVDEVRAVELRHGRDDATIKLALEFAEDGNAWAARDAGETVGVVLTHRSDEEVYVGELVVEPSYRGLRIGARLFDAALADAGNGARSALLDASDRASLALALRSGLAPRATVLRVAGAIPREDGLLAMAAGDYRFQVDAIDPAAHAFALSALDRENRGTTRLRDHRRLSRDAEGLAFLSDGEFVAYAYVWPDGRIGPMAAASGAYLVQIFAYALVTLQRRFGASWCTALIPGTNVRLLRAALRAGLRIEETLTFASDAEISELSRYAGFHRLLF